MAFGQASGPPATAAQLAELAELLARTGFESFREARHPYGLTQRQANGKFTRGEADELAERLRVEVGDADVPGFADEPGDPATASGGRSSTHPARSRSAPLPPAPDPAPDDVVRAFPDELLAAELGRRGWECVPPTPEVS